MVTIWSWQISMMLLFEQIHRMLIEHPFFEEFISAPLPSVSISLYFFGIKCIFLRWNLDSTQWPFISTSALPWKITPMRHIARWDKSYISFLIPLLMAYDYNLQYLYSASHKKGNSHKSSKVVWILSWFIERVSFFLWPV